MNLPLTIANIPPEVIILLVIIFVVGRWVYNKMQEFKAHMRKLQTGLENPNQEVAAPTSDEGRATRSGGGAGTPGNLSASEHAEREKARQQYAERAERLRAQRLGKGMPGGAASGQATQADTGAGQSEEGWTSMPSPAKVPQTQSQSQAPMAQSRPLPSQQPKALPTNQPAHQKAQPAPAQVARKQTVRAQAPQSLQTPEAIIPGAPAGVGIGEETQAQQRARGGQPKALAPQAAKVTSQAPVQHTLGRIGTIEELRRAVVLKEILDQPVSLRE